MGKRGYGRGEVYGEVIHRGQCVKYSVKECVKECVKRWIKGHKIMKIQRKMGRVVSNTPMKGF